MHNQHLLSVLIHFTATLILTGLIVEASNHPTAMEKLGTVVEKRSGLAVGCVVYDLDTWFFSINLMQ